MIWIALPDARKHVCVCRHTHHTHTPYIHTMHTHRGVWLHYNAECSSMKKQSSHEPQKNTNKETLHVSLSLEMDGRKQETLASTIHEIPTSRQMILFTDFLR